MYWDSQQGCLSVAQDYMILPFGSVFALIISSPSLKLLFIVHKFFSASLSCLYWSTLSSGMSWFDLSLWWHVTFSYCMCLTRCSAVLAANITNCEWVLLVGQFAGKGSWEIWFQSMCSLSCLGFIIVKFFIIERCNSIVGCVHTGRLLPKLSTVATLGWALMAIAADEVNELTAGSQVFQNNNHSCDCLSFLLCSCLLSSSQCPTVWNGSCCLFISPGPSPAIRLAPCAPSATPSHNATTDFSPLCCWAWPALLLGLREQTQKSRFSLIWCLALSSSVLHLLVMWTQLHLQLLQLLAQTFHPVPSMSVWQPNLACQSLIQLPLIQLSRESGKLWQKILCYVEWEIDSAINKAIASK